MIVKFCTNQTTTAIMQSEENLGSRRATDVVNCFITNFEHVERRSFEGDGGFFIFPLKA